MAQPPPNPILKKLGDITVDDFLSNYWQKKPVLLRGVFDNWSDPVTAEELAGLACEPLANTRLVESTENGPKLTYGPLSEETFKTLSKDQWSFLIQEVDHWIPEVAELRKRFRFIPDWRIDDVMVSYSEKGGGVGAHVDSYDVFLIQGSGSRLWQIEEKTHPSKEMTDHNGLMLLDNFQATQEWELGPGDVLYLPPHIPHNGRSQDSCLTFSIGFLSPSIEDIVRYVDADLSALDPDKRYKDPDICQQPHPAEITESAIKNAQKLCAPLQFSAEEIPHWFGRLVTEKKRPDESNDIDAQGYFSVEEFTETWKEATTLIKNEDSRLAFYKGDKTNLLFFVNGLEYMLPHQLVEDIIFLTEQNEISTHAFTPDESKTYLWKLLTDLVNEGIFCLE